MRSSRAAVNFIIACEVGSREQYDRRYYRPTWPGGRSGVTVAIGYDLGYTDRDKVLRDFHGLVPSAMIVAMQNVCGLTGSAAHAALAGIHDKVVIPWSVAVEVFENVDAPRYEHMLFRACPKAAALPADCVGALASLTYNRGAGGYTAGGDRFREMRAIRAAIESDRPELVPDQIRSMKRLWGQDQRGLLIRRDGEAKLFEQGLVNQTGALPSFLNKRRVPEVTPESNPEPDPTPIDPEDDPSLETVRRPKDDNRPNVTAKDLRGKLPMVDHTWWQKVWAFILGIPSAAGAVFKWLFGDQGSISDYIDPVKDFFAAIPPELYLVVAAGIAIAVFVQAKRVQDATVEAYRRGDIN